MPKISKAYKYLVKGISINHSKDGEHVVFVPFLHFSFYMAGRLLKFIFQYVNAKSQNIIVFDLMNKLFKIKSLYEPLHEHHTSISSVGTKTKCRPNIIPYIICFRISKLTCFPCFRVRWYGPRSKPIWGILGRTLKSSTCSSSNLHKLVFWGFIHRPISRISHRPYWTQLRCHIRHSSISLLLVLFHDTNVGQTLL